MAILYRINARSEDFEEALAAASIPYQVRDGAFLRRPGPRAVLARLRRATAEDVAAASSARSRARSASTRRGQVDSDEEVTRQADLSGCGSSPRNSRRHPIGRDLAAPTLRARFATERQGRGVQL